MGLPIEGMRRDARGFIDLSSRDFLGSRQREMYDESQKKEREAQRQREREKKEAARERERLMRRNSSHEIVIEQMAAGAAQHPFKISIAARNKISIYPGTVNNEVPTGMEHGAMEMKLTKTSDVCLKCTFDNTGLLTNAILQLAYEEPTDTTYTIRIGQAVWQHDAIAAVYNYVQNSLGIACCPDAKHADYWEIGAPPAYA